MNNQPQRGMRDLLPKEYTKHLFVVDQCRILSDLYGFYPISTPILESVDLFKRSAGEGSDIVRKEMYTFTDQGGHEVCLRPEGTAAVMRAFINEGLTQTLPQKFYHFGPMFRYERPQKGRYRQFDQFSLECIGDSTPFRDAEIIHLASRILKFFKANYTLELNTVGDLQSRGSYKIKLVDYLNRYQNELSKDSQSRLIRNPLRILDSKDETDQKILENAPILSDSLNLKSKHFYDAVKCTLTDWNIDFFENQKLVRGLDYYTHTVFEFTTPHLGTCATLIAGGRYDGLCEQIGGPSIAGVGCSVGIDRLILLMDRVKIPKILRVGVIPLGCEVEPAKLLNLLRDTGISSEWCHKSDLSKSLKLADRLNLDLAVIMGETEHINGTVLIKDLKKQFELAKDQQAIPIESLIQFLDSIQHKK